jgi:hypothetical protein
MTHHASREHYVAALGRYLTTQHGRTTTLRALASRYDLDEIYVGGVVWELRQRHELAVTIVESSPTAQLPIPATPAAPHEQVRIAHLDAVFETPPDRHESVSRLAARYNLSRSTVRRRLHAAGWSPLPEFPPHYPRTDAEHETERIDTIRSAYTNGQSNKDIARYLRITVDLVESVIEQHEMGGPDWAIPSTALPYQDRA